MRAAVHFGAGANHGAFLAPYLAALDVVRAHHVANETDNPQSACRHEPHGSATQAKITGHATGEEQAREGDQRYPHAGGVAP